jgi:outer membrane protein OmpA-like peptidoglycan-associated protein
MAVKVGVFSRKEAANSKLSCWLLILSLPLVFTACSSQRMLAQKDKEIAILRAELQNYQGEKTRAGCLTDDLQKALADLEAERKLRVEGNRIVMPNAVLFSSGSVQISEDGRKILDGIWDVLEKYPGGKS